MKLKESELKVEILMPENSGDFDSYIAAAKSAPVRITHIPTRISAIGSGQESQTANKSAAIELIIEKINGDKGGQGDRSTNLPESP
jgi:protein subunit release factor A